MTATGQGYCQHQRLEGNCETCAYDHANQRGYPLADSLPTFRYVPVIADTDMLIADEGSDLNRSTYIAAGTPVPPEHVAAATQPAQP